MSKKILVVDDDESICELLKFVLERDGFGVVLAKDGEQALRYAEAEQPDLILLDLMLPRYGGFEILRQLQKPKTGSIQIIVMTGRYTDRSTQELIRGESNVVDFMEKPINTAALVARIHTLLKTSPPAP
ncbi:MAG: response regulator transcription factor [Elusimicrobia bacterium]|nr:response regulator transcription factor [Elusimicrobiota bacterium]